MARLPRGQGLDEIAAFHLLVTVDVIAALHHLVAALLRCRPRVVPGTRSDRQGAHGSSCGWRREGLIEVQAAPRRDLTPQRFDIRPQGEFRSECNFSATADICSHL